MKKSANKRPAQEAPAVEQKAPVMEQKAPVVEQKKPVVEQEAPAVKQKAPPAIDEVLAADISHEDVERLASFADYLTRLNLAEYVRLTQKPARMMWFNFISGVARGFGIAVGFTLLGALGIYVLRQLQVLNLPLVGDLIAQIWEYVEMAREIRI
jgi:hypothetical protein